MVRVCLVYDHVYPATIGGGERWMHGVAMQLAASGHAVTYLTMRHWQDDDAPAIPGVRVIGLVPAGTVRDGERRTLGPPVRFGAAVARHLLRHRQDYDVVHIASFPYFPLLGAALVRRFGSYRLVVDWYEVWTRDYWRRYAGTVVGTIGWLVQRMCIGVPQVAFCISSHTRGRLVAEGFRGSARVLNGLYDGIVVPTPHHRVEPLVVFAGRQIPEKRIPLLLEGFVQARSAIPELRLELYGDGPERDTIQSVVTRVGLGEAVSLKGRRPQSEVEEAMARAACLATASEREGYGLIVVEAAARGTPTVIVAGQENAATELVVEGVNGAVADHPTAREIGAAIVRAVSAGHPLRSSTELWFHEHESVLRLDASLRLIDEAYREGLSSSGDHETPARQAARTRGPTA